MFNITVYNHHLFINFIVQLFLVYLILLFANMIYLFLLFDCCHCVGSYYSCTWSLIMIINHLLDCYTIVCLFIFWYDWSSIWLYIGLSLFSTHLRICGSTSWLVWHSTTVILWHLLQFLTQHTVVMINQLIPHILNEFLQILKNLRNIVTLWRNEENEENEEMKKWRNV